ncbi:DUF350 domain-containing protein [Metabacillus herbersteinensis]|uniref:DUF350 domain-containing protein n=1 Tax=Metabacillus herbersteinensis TaxID=283816 RepID=A0ABV6GFS9_9BACI
MIWSEIMDFQELWSTLLYFVVLMGVTVGCMAIFELITPFNDREEMKNGNTAVAIQFAGKIVGLSLVMFSSIFHNASLLAASVWGIIGFILMLIGYFIFEFLTPAFKVDQEIKNGNNSVAIVAASISLAIGIIVAGSIS